MMGLRLVRSSVLDGLGELHYVADGDLLIDGPFATRGEAAERLHSLNDARRVDAKRAQLDYRRAVRWMDR